MGTKRKIAPKVKEIAGNLPDGPFLDLFSGMCAVAHSVHPNRNIWCNDVQFFASFVAKAFFKSQSLPPTSIDAAFATQEDYRENFAKLQNRFESDLNEEITLLNKKNVNNIKSFYTILPHIGNSQNMLKTRNWLYYKPKTFPYRLFSITYAGGYFGLKQCLQIDSIRYAIDFLLSNNKITKENHLWMLLALCEAISKSSTSTGHFAQYLTINSNNKCYYLEQRNKSIWNEWLKAVDSLCPVGEKSWRINNRVYRTDANKLLNSFLKTAFEPSIVYADPPYTDDQYSRFYHIYETLILYDYPKSVGKGRYRENRYSSSFSLKSLVYKSFEDLIKSVSGLKCSFILSYPTNGLIPESEKELLSLIKNYFRKAEIVYRISHKHSSLGASKGYEKYSVEELLYLGRN